MAAEPITAEPITAESLMREVRARHPRLGEALVADAAVTAEHRGERYEFRSRLDAALQVLRLMWASDAFAAGALPSEGPAAGARRARAASAWRTSCR